MSAIQATSKLAGVIERKFGTEFLGSKQEFGQSFLFVQPKVVPQVIECLRDEHGFDYFSECVGIDYSKWEHARDFQTRFEVVYNLMSTSTGERIMIKTGVDEGQSIPTSKHIFIGAEYPEREINDLFGVVFEGNEQTTRFLLPDDWTGYPLRKEYPLGGEDVLFDQGSRGPAVEDIQMPHAGESFDGKTGSEDVGGR